ncbi:hypothetical protein MCHLDSM_00313 [Mycolicibacterium chlorophenolicum]|uniref:Uncharacterized protein n=1 Tax=Mycolicibacterium chlorophenolicum TaxID=37916 RepID=A0A0J6ZFT8_9MYCO|nr:hypothetical protein MCHLDSM_00313 [Mycolicibacterium chlorophenolicum]
MENAAVEGAATTGRRPLQGRPQTPLIGHAELSLPALRLAVARDDGTTCGAGNGEQGSAIGSGGYLEVSMRVPWCDERRSSLLRLPPRPLTTNSLSDRDTPTAKPSNTCAVCPEGVGSAGSVAPKHLALCRRIFFAVAERFGRCWSQRPNPEDGRRCPAVVRDPTCGTSPLPYDELHVCRRAIASVIARNAGAHARAPDLPDGTRREAEARRPHRNREALAGVRRSLRHRPDWMRTGPAG